MTDCVSLTQDDVLTVICNVLNLDEVGPEAAMGKVRGWDSFGQITLVLALEEAAEIKLPGDAFGRMMSVQSIMEVLQEEGVLKE
jgi:acyl carrier protein